VRSPRDLGFYTDWHLSMQTHVKHTIPVVYRLRSCDTCCTVHQVSHDQSLYENQSQPCHVQGPGQIYNIPSLFLPPFPLALPPFLFFCPLHSPFHDHHVLLMFRSTGQRSRSQRDIKPGPHLGCIQPAYNLKMQTACRLHTLVCSLAYVYSYARGRRRKILVLVVIYKYL